MDLSVVKTAHANWQNFASVPGPELKKALSGLSEHPTPEATAFFSSVVQDFDPDDTDGYWIQQAIKYAGNLKSNPEEAIHYLETMLGNYQRYRVIGSSLGTAAYSLGRIASYPNAVLARAMEGDAQDHYVPSAPEDEDADLVTFIKKSAYGAYIMTATDFQTGFDASQELKESPRQPTVRMAEDFISKWRESHDQR